MKRTIVGIILLLVLGGCASTSPNMNPLGHDSTWQELVQKGDRARENGDAAEAARYYEQALEIDSDNLHALVQLGEVYRQLHRLDEAEASLRKALDLDPGTVQAASNDAYFYLGSVLFEQGSTEEAVAALEEAIRRFPGDARAQDLLDHISKQSPHGLNASTDKNYITSTSYLIPIQEETLRTRLADHQVARSINYYDGLGKRSQSIAIRRSPQRNDLVTPVRYNEIGLEAISYLPYAANEGNGAFKDDAVAEQLLFYQQAPQVAASEYPFAETVFEASPLLRVVEEGAPGAAWQPTGRTPSSGHTVKTRYRTNEAGEVRLWAWNETAARFQTDGAYRAGVLHVVELEDANGGVVTEYQDLAGRVVLKRVHTIDTNSNEIRLDTYYLFDDFGNLRYIVSPKAVFAMLNSGAWFIDPARDRKWVTEYVYDGSHRLVEKKMPGAEPFYTIYDQLGRPVLVQDGNLRATNDWIFTKYDVRGRPVLSGIYHDDTHTSRAAMQAYAETFVDDSRTFFYERRTSTQAALHHGYTNQAFPPHDASRLLTVTYYDDYDFNTDGTDDVAFTPDAELEQQHPNWKPFYRLQDKTTGHKIKAVSTWIETATFYDKHERAIQTRATNMFGGADLVHTAYDFAGKAVASKRVHASAYGSVTIRKRYAYDHAGRLYRVYQQHDDDPEVLVAQNRYNERGDLIEKNLHSEDDGAHFLQSVDYAYTIQGWITHINDPEAANLVQPGDIGIAGNDLFGQRLWYEEATDRLENVPQFNGNISATDWAVAPPPPLVTSSGLGGPLQPATIHSYIYAYDRLNQLTAARYRHRYPFGTSAEGDEQFNVEASYDPNGNIASIRRGGLTRVASNGSTFYGRIDDLSYVYSGNQLTSVWDRLPDHHGYDFYNRGGYQTGQAYSYDANGNLIADPNKGIASIAYNHLDLPTRVTFDDGNWIQWIYDARGTKLQKRVRGSDGVVTTRFYVDGIVYENGKLDFIAMDEGRVKRLEDGSLRYEYHLTDHLGNVRVALAKGTSATSPLVLQEDHYYPFGMKFGGRSVVKEGKENKFTYNGKELEDEHGLHWFHYGARYYDPQLARWHTMDPVDEFHSPYTYVANNPVRFIDPDGQNPVAKTVEKSLTWIAKRGATLALHPSKKHAMGGGLQSLVRYVFENAVPNRRVIQNYAGSRLIKGSQAKKLVTRVLKGYDHVTDQGGRYLFQKVFERDIGRGGERILRVVVDKATGRVVTYFPAQTFAVVVAFGATVALEEGIAEAASAGELARARHVELADPGIWDWILPQGVSSIGWEPDMREVSRLTSELIQQVESNSQQSLDPETRAEIYNTVLRAYTGEL